MLINNVKNKEVVVGIQNLKVGVYSFSMGGVSDNCLMIVSPTPKQPSYNHHTHPVGNISNGYCHARCYCIYPCGAITKPVIDGSWESQRFERIADSFDITVPGQK